MFDVIPWDGKPISAPGIYSGVPIGVYHGTNLCVAPSISSSGLRTIFGKSAYHYWAFSPYNPGRYENKETAALILGRATHHMLLGEPGFWAQYVERPERYLGKKWDSNRGECGEWIAEQELNKLTILLPSQVEAIRGMAQGLAQDPLVAAGVLDGLIEHVIIGIDRETGTYIKARPDAIPNYSGDYGDMKTTTAVDDETIQKTIDDYAYHQQGALIGRLSDEVLSLKMNSFNLAFVESKPPHCARTITLKDHDIELGYAQNQAAVRAFARGMRTGVWNRPGGTRSDGQTLGLKRWAIDNINWRLSEMAREEEFAK